MSLPLKELIPDCPSELGPWQRKAQKALWGVGSRFCYLHLSKERFQHGERKAMPPDPGQLISESHMAHLGFAL